MDSLAKAVRSIYPPSNTGRGAPASGKRRPLSFGSFIGSGFGRRNGSASSLTSTSLSPLLTPVNVGASRVHHLPETLEDEEAPHDITVIDEMEDDSNTVIFASWFEIGEFRRRRLLIIGYEQGFQIWDTADLLSIEEIIHLRDEAPFNNPIFSAGLVEISSEGRYDCIVVLLCGSKASSDTEFIAYSLTTHTVLQQLLIPRALHLEANRHHIVISSIRPPTLHIISSTTLTKTHTLSNVASHAAFSLSLRFLAFASPAPQDQERHLYNNPGVISRSPPPSLSSMAATPIGGAIKVGQGLFSGAKLLGGMAYAASNKLIETQGSYNSNSGEGTSVGQWFSRSAPAASSFRLGSPLSTPARRRDSMTRSPALRPVDISESPTTDKMSYEGTWIIVVDLAQDVREIHRFRASTHKPVTRFHWSKSGTQLYATSVDGQTVAVYSVRPDPAITTSRPPTSDVGQRSPLLRRTSQMNVKAGMPWHLYDLHRGHTSAKVCSIDTAGDGRWVAVATQRGTIHVFATNPYGGVPDIPSHMQGKVLNVEALQPLSTSLVPLTRIRPAHFIARSEDEDASPIAVHFLSHTESLALEVPLAPNQERLATMILDETTKGHNFQDVLVFNPSSSVIELYRIKLDVIDASAQSPTPRSITDSPTTRLASSHSPKVLAADHHDRDTSDKGTSALTRLMARGQSKGRTLQGKESSVATWLIKRDADWEKVKLPVTRDMKQLQKVTSRIDGQSMWLAEAEISTFSPSPQVLAPSIYLSHQFSFHSFDKEYDALLRSHVFAVPTSPIIVRKEVEVVPPSDSQFTVHDSFDQMSSSRPMSGSKVFEGPMGNALNDSLDYSHSSPPVYPGLPNGSSLNSKTGLLDAIAVRKSKDIAYGVGEGIGRLKREIAKARSPRLVPVDHPEHLREQDFEDEELLDNALTDGDGESHTHSGLSGSIHTPEDQGVWDGEAWGAEEQAAIEEQERFDEIYPAGMMDEDSGEVPSRTPRRGVVKHSGKKGAG